MAMVLQQGVKIIGSKYIFKSGWKQEMDESQAPCEQWTEVKRGHGRRLSKHKGE